MAIQTLRLSQISTLDLLWHNLRRAASGCAAMYSPPF